MHPQIEGQNKPMPSPLQAPPGAAKRAREQATTYDSVFAPTPMVLTMPDGSSETIEIPPHPNLRMFDDDAQETYEELLVEIDEQYDREPDVYFPEQHLDSGMVLPAETRRGAVKQPYRKDGELVKPVHTVRVVQIALGDTDYAKLKAAGKQAADVWRIWAEQARALEARQDTDPKSNGSASTVAALPR